MHYGARLALQQEIRTTRLSFGVAPIGVAELFTVKRPVGCQKRWSSRDLQHYGMRSSRQAHINVTSRPSAVVSGSSLLRYFHPTTLTTGLTLTLASPLSILFCGSF